MNRRPQVPPGDMNYGCYGPAVNFNQYWGQQGQNWDQYYGQDGYHRWTPAPHPWQAGYSMGHHNVPPQHVAYHGGQPRQFPAQQRTAVNYRGPPQSAAYPGGQPRQFPSHQGTAVNYRGPAPRPLYQEGYAWNQQAAVRSGQPKGRATTNETAIGNNKADEHAPTAAVIEDDVKEEQNKKKRRRRRRKNKKQDAPDEEQQKDQKETDDDPAAPTEKGETNTDGEDEKTPHGHESPKEEAAPAKSADEEEPEKDDQQPAFPTEKCENNTDGEDDRAPHGQESPKEEAEHARSADEEGPEKDGQQPAFPTEKGENNTDGEDDRAPQGQESPKEEAEPAKIADEEKPENDGQQPALHEIKVRNVEKNNRQDQKESNADAPTEKFVNNKDYEDEKAPQGQESPEEEAAPARGECEKEQENDGQQMEVQETKAPKVEKNLKDHTNVDEAKAGTIKEVITQAYKQEENEEGRRECATTIELAVEKMDAQNKSAEDQQNKDSEDTKDVNEEAGKKKKHRKKRMLNWTIGNVLNTMLGRNGYAHHSSNFPIHAEPEDFTDEERHAMAFKWHAELAYLELETADVGQIDGRENTGPVYFDIGKVWDAERAQQLRRDLKFFKDGALMQTFEK